jgi:hypothetical protein
MTREAFHSWVLQISREALVADPVAATEVIRALTGGHEVFCPQGHSSDRLHRAAAAFLTIARL